MFIITKPINSLSIAQKFMPNFIYILKSTNGPEEMIIRNQQTCVSDFSFNSSIYARFSSLYFQNIIHPYDTTNISLSDFFLQFFSLIFHKYQMSRGHLSRTDKETHISTNWLQKWNRFSQRPQHVCFIYGLQYPVLLQLRSS